MRRWLREHSRLVVLAVAALVVLGLFLGVITPLFATSGLPEADLGGTLPTQATANATLEIDLAIDNVGDPVLRPVCISALTAGPLTPSHVIFQGIDNEPFAHGSACGGALSSQESISVQIFLQAGAPGDARLTLAPMEGRRTVGAALSGRITVAAP